MRNKLIAIAIVTAVLFSQAAFAEQGPKDADFEKHHDKIMKQLNLTPEQEKQLKDYREQEKAEIKKEFGELKAKREELRSQLNNPQVSENTIRQTAGQLEAMQAKMMARRIDSILYMRKVLTPEQFTKFQELTKEKRGEFMRKCWKNRGLNK